MVQCLVTMHKSWVQVPVPSKTKMCRWKKLWTSILLYSSVFLNSKLTKMASILYSFKEHEID